MRRRIKALQYSLSRYTELTMKAKHVDYGNFVLFTQILTCSGGGGGVLKPVSRWASRCSQCSGKGLLLLVGLVTFCLVGGLLIKGTNTDFVYKELSRLWAVLK